MGKTQETSFGADNKAYTSEVDEVDSGGRGGDTAFNARSQRSGGARHGEVKRARARDDADAASRGGT